jgi:anaerobic ribonucleoside-triphosphate reductase activating protein
MSRDTWDPAAGSQVGIEDLVGAWRRAREHGATGLTVSGGEPAEQAAGIAELIRRIRQADAGLPGDPVVPFDVLIFSGLAEEEFLAVSPALARCADAAMLGRFDVTKPTDMIWRGSANQRLVTFTALGTERYAPYLTATTSSPAMQFVVDADRIWTIGVPRIGDMTALERRLLAHGVEVRGVSWRP